jgi:hypothetical protein
LPLKLPKKLRRGQLALHLLTAHIYTPGVVAWTAALDRLVAGETSNVTVKPLVVSDTYFYSGQSPLVVSEWGGFGFPAYGGPSETEEKAERIRRFKRELRRRPVAGDVYTQATSIEEENNGIIDARTGEPLVPPGLLGSHALAD